MAVAGSVGSAARRARHSAAAARARMAVALPRLALSRDPSAAPLRRALTAALGDRIGPAERDWSHRIEAHRNALLHDAAETGPAFDPGSEGPAGGISMHRGRTTVRDASMFMSLPRPWCVLLLRLVRELEPRACLELGTGFGISGSYLAAGLELNSAGTLTTLEGADDWARIADRGFRDLGLADRVERVIGPIAESLSSLPSEAGPFGLAFIDAEHQAEPTLEHFAAILPRLAPGAVVVLDDVAWQPMRQAWRRLVAHRRVSLTVTVGRLGLALVEQEGAA